jgi:hypothetical protein
MAYARTLRLPGRDGVVAKDGKVLKRDFAVMREPPQRRGGPSANWQHFV